MSDKIITYKVQRSEDHAAFYCPYIPLAFGKVEKLNIPNFVWVNEDTANVNGELANSKEFINWCVENKLTMQDSNIGHIVRVLDEKIKMLFILRWS